MEARPPGRSRRTRSRARRCRRRRRVTFQAAWERLRWAGWASRSSKRSARNRKASRKPARECARHRRRRAASRSRPPDARRGARSGSRTCPRSPRPCSRTPPGGASAAARARAASRRLGTSVRSTASASTRRRRRVRGVPAQAPRAQRRQRGRVGHRVPDQRAARGAGPEHLAAGARQEVVAHGRRARASASRSRPAACADITIPIAQRRRNVCQAHPARMRSSRGIGGSAPLAHVVAPRRPAMAVGAPARARSARSRRRAPMLESGAGPRSGSGPRRLCSGAATPPRRRGPGCASSKPPTRSKALRRIGHVGRPDERRIAVLGAEVERGDRRRLAAAGARSAALEPRPDRARRIPRDRALAAAPRSIARAIPAGASHVVVDEDHQIAIGEPHAAVARRVRPRRRVERDAARCHGAATSICRSRDRRRR